MNHQLYQRRECLQALSRGGLALSLAGLSGRVLSAESRPSSDLLPHHEPKVKRVLFLFMHGGPSQVDTFDFKPELQKADGKDLPFEAPPNLDAKPVLMKSPWKFSRRGESGLWVSELFPHIGKKMDDLCVIRSMYSRGQSHGQAVSMLHTGSDNLVRPSVGSWVSFGLGSENDRLPAFVSIGPSSGHGGPRNYGSAFLPTEHQATTIGRQGKIGDGKIDFLKPKSPDAKREQKRLRLIEALNGEHLQRVGSDTRIEGMMESFDLAARMQEAAPEVLDLAQESESTQKLYGVGQQETDNFGREVQIASQLVHPNTIEIYDYGESEAGQLYFAMEYIQGNNLKELIEAEAPLDVERCLSILIQISEALSEAHSKGVIHRDIKPQNIMVGPRGMAKDFVKVLDFGLATVLDSRSMKPERIAGTLRYMAPECFLEPTAVGPPTDVYSLSAVAYEMFQGTSIPPLGLSEMSDIGAWARRLEALARSLRSSEDPQRDKLRLLIIAGLSTNLAVRPKDANEFLIRLRQIQSS